MSQMPDRIPKYDELPVISENGERHNRGIFGQDDELGTINFLTPERVRKAASLVHTGAVFNLCLPLNQPNPPLNPGRKPYRHTFLVLDHNLRDDVVDNFYPQASSQIDGLQHLRYPEFGFYNGRQDAEIAQGVLSIQRWAEHGIAGRGVLIDVPRYLAKQGTHFSPQESFAIMPDLLSAVAASEGVVFQPGDILLLRTGWLGFYLQLTQAERVSLAAVKLSEFSNPGLYAGREMAAFLWNHQVAMVAADTRAVEQVPRQRDVGWLHHRLIPLLGMPLGEFWFLEELAKDCAEDGIYQFMVVVIPWNMPEGVGSPANAVAIK